MNIRIGRSRKNDFVIENMTVSREHAVLEVVDGNIILRDTGSASGTYIVAAGGVLEKTTYKVVSESDTIQLGDERLLVKTILEQASIKNREARYERNPITGEIIKK